MDEHAQLAVEEPVKFLVGQLGNALIGLGDALRQGRRGRRKTGLGAGSGGCERRQDCKGNCDQDSSGFHERS
jgi:hypothetical protein